MVIRRTYSITPDRLPDGTGRLRFRIAFGSNRLAFNLGVRVDLDKWNNEAQRSKPNTTHGKKKIPATYINRLIQSFTDTADRLFFEYEGQDTIPTTDQLRNDFNKALKRSTTTTQSDQLLTVMERYIDDKSHLNQWAFGSIRGRYTVIARVKRYDPKATLTDITKKWLEKFVTHLIYTQKLSNITTKDTIKRLFSVLRWAESNGLAVPPDYHAFTMRLQTIKKPVIFLTWDELMDVYHTELPQPYLAKARDLFCFSCFTSLRFSDVQNLKKNDIKGDYIEIVTIKTSDPIRIDLNKYSRTILKKYASLEGDFALPQISNQKINGYIKEIGAIVGINAPITIVELKTGNRKETTQPKWRLLSSHAGRRTFICNSLIMGIPPNIVMKWTGHGDYNAMKPYIDIADNARKTAMEKWDNMP